MWASRITREYQECVGPCAQWPPRPAYSRVSPCAIRSSILSHAGEQRVMRAEAHHLSHSWGPKVGTLLSPRGILFSEPRASSAGTEQGAGTVAEGGLCAECTREEGVYTMVYREDTTMVYRGTPTMVYPGYTHPPWYTRAIHTQQWYPGLYTPNSDNPGYTAPYVRTRAIPHPMYVPGLYTDQQW